MVLFVDQIIEDPVVADEMVTREEEPRLEAIADVLV